MRKVSYIYLLLGLLVCLSCQTPTSTKQDKEEYISQRHLQDKAFEKSNIFTEQQWDSLNNFKQIVDKEGNIRSDYKVFGWHMYSDGSAYENYIFSALWGISYYTYSVQPRTGSYKSIHQWKTTAIVDSAKSNGCKVFLSVSNHGKYNNSIFLENSRSQKTLIDSLSSLLALRNADGINIDFEGVEKKDRRKFTKFILQVSKNLKKRNPNYMISLCLYANDANDIFDINAINSHIDFYTLMGYDYFGSWSIIAGPVTPFDKSENFGNGLKHTVNYYLNKGVNPDKLIVGLPYYGAEWYTESDEIGSRTIKFKSHPPYRLIRDYYIDSLSIPLQFDPKSSSSYIVIKDSINNYRQLFFEDVKSLSIKYDWIKNNKIGGVGIWALGYDNGYPELWNLLTRKFSQEQNTTLYNNK